MIKPATSDQCQEINRLLANGHIDFAAAQRIIDEYGRMDAYTRFWEERYPECGSLLMEILRPCYKTTCVLRPPTPNLSARLTKGFFWIDDFKDPKCCTMAEIEAYCGDIATTLDDHLRQYHYSATSVTLNGLDPWEPIISRFSSEGGRPGGGLLSLPEGIPWQVESCLWRGYSCVIRYACAYAKDKNEDRVSELMQLIRLFHEGNMPIGFTKDGILLVLVDQEQHRRSSSPSLSED